VGLEDPGTTGPDGPAYSPAGRHGWIDAADAVGAFLFLEDAFLFLEDAFLSWKPLFWLEVEGVEGK